MVKRYLKRSKGEIPVGQLVEFYDSHGLTPEDVKEVASKTGLAVSIPEDFYSLVALRHMGGKEEKNGTTEADLTTKVEDVDNTRTFSESFKKAVHSLSIFHLEQHNGREKF